MLGRLKRFNRRLGPRIQRGKLDRQPGCGHLRFQPGLINRTKGEVKRSFRHMLGYLNRFGRWCHGNRAHFKRLPMGHTVNCSQQHGHRQRGWLVGLQGVHPILEHTTCGVHKMQ